MSQGSSNVHDAALSTLQELRKKYPISVNPLLPHVFLSILHDRELKAGNLGKAEAVGIMLRSVSLVQGHGSGVELWAGGCYQHVEVSEMRLGARSEATKCCAFVITCAFVSNSPFRCSCSRSRGSGRRPGRCAPRATR